MASTSPYEKRRSERVQYQERGFLRVEGEELLTLRIRDAGSAGIGAYSRKPVAIGSRGVLDVKLATDEQPRPYDTEVRWCCPSDDREVSLYSFRLGLMILPSAKPSPRPLAPPAPEPLAEPAGGHRVKGSMIIDFVKMVRLHHDRPWNKYLSLDDMDLIHQMIIPAKWYPLGFFQRIGTAVFEVFGKGSDESVRQWGRDLIARVPADLYKNFFDKGDPKKAVANYINVNMRIFDFLRFKCEDAGPAEIKVHAIGDPGVMEQFPELRLLGLLLAGALEELARRNQAGFPTAKIEGTSRGLYLLTITLKWSLPS